MNAREGRQFRVRARGARRLSSSSACGRAEHISRTAGGERWRAPAVSARTLSALCAPYTFRPLAPVSARPRSLGQAGAQLGVLRRRPAEEPPGPPSAAGRAGGGRQPGGGVRTGSESLRADRARLAAAYPSRFSVDRCLPPLFNRFFL